MTETVSFVPAVDDGTQVFPEWLVPGAVLLRALRERGVLEGIEERLRISREGGYVGLDGVLFLALYFASHLRCGIKTFHRRLAPYSTSVAALVGRRRLPTPSSISRLLSAADEKVVEEFGQWLLTTACGGSALLAHPAVAARDTMGDAWQVFDWDPTVTTMRQRALPEGPELPQARRRSSTAAAGYSGRKRGDVQFSRATLQHAGSSLWQHVRIGPGNGEHRCASRAAIRTVAQVAEQNAWPRERVLLRVDGAGGNVPFLTACGEEGIRVVTRLARYELLERHDVRRQLASACWIAVPSSGSGPTRQVAELGNWLVSPGQQTRKEDGSAYEDVPCRIVVTRFRPKAETESDEAKGDGIVFDGWQYEMFATTLPPESWPSHELVALYYGRAAIENRFLQEDRHLDLDHVFSYQIAGQTLVTLVGLFVWNLEVVAGFEIEAPPQAIPPQAPARVVFAAPKGDDATGPPTIGSEIVPSDFMVPCEAETPKLDPPTPPPKTRRPRPHDEDFDEWRRYMNSLPWKDALDTTTGWSWDDERAGPTCPRGLFCTPSRIRRQNLNVTKVVFKAPTGACPECPSKGACTSSNKPNFSKQVAIPIHPLDVPRLKTLINRIAGARLSLRREARQTFEPASIEPATPPFKPDLPPPGPKWLGTVAPLLCGILCAVPAVLLPAVLRHAFALACSHLTIEVALAIGPPPPPKIACFAYSDAERQHRRHTWSQRLRFNALPQGTDVRMTVIHPRSGTPNRSAFFPESGYTSSG